MQILPAGTLPLWRCVVNVRSMFLMKCSRFYHEIALLTDKDKCRNEHISADSNQGQNYNRFGVFGGGLEGGANQSKTLSVRLLPIHIKPAAALPQSKTTIQNSTFHSFTSKLVPMYYHSKSRPNILGNGSGLRYGQNANTSQRFGNGKDLP